MQLFHFCNCFCGTRSSGESTPGRPRGSRNASSKWKNSWPGLVIFSEKNHFTFWNVPREASHRSPSMPPRTRHVPLGPDRTSGPSLATRAAAATAVRRRVPSPHARGDKRGTWHIFSRSMLKIYLPRSGYPKIIAYATLWHTNNFLLLAGTCNFFRKKPFHFLKRSFQKVKWRQNQAKFAWFIRQKNSNKILTKIFWWKFYKLFCLIYWQNNSNKILTNARVR